MNFQGYTGERNARTTSERKTDSEKRKKSYADKIAKNKAMRAIEEEKKVQERPDWMLDPSKLPKRPPGRKTP